jgi:hypothetical protein
MTSISNNSSLQQSFSNEFTDNEIREQLQLLGFKNFSQEKFSQFKRDLEKLISEEVSINNENDNHADENRKATRTTLEEKLDGIDDDFRARADEMRLREHQMHHQQLLRNKHVTFPSDSQIITNLSCFKQTQQHQNNNKNTNHESSDESEKSFISTTSSIVDNRVMKRKIRRLISKQHLCNKRKIFQLIN